MENQGLSGIEVFNLFRVRAANPSIWEGETADGECVHACFICGSLDVGKGATPEEAKLNRREFFSFNDDSDILEESELLRIMKWVKK